MANTSLTTHDTPLHEFYASCPEGFETALADELRGMGLRQVRPLKGRVAFAGSPADAERACLWSRLASRIFVVLGRFACANAEDLYEATRSIAWERILRAGATIAVTARGTNDELRNSHFAALRVKDALCDRMLEVEGRRPNVDTDDPDARISHPAWQPREHPARSLRRPAVQAPSARGHANARRTRPAPRLRSARLRPGQLARDLLGRTH